MGCRDLGHVTQAFEPSGDDAVWWRLEGSREVGPFSATEFRDWRQGPGRSVPRDELRLRHVAWQRFYTGKLMFEGAGDEAAEDEALCTAPATMVVAEA